MGWKLRGDFPIFSKLLNFPQLNIQNYSSQKTTMKTILTLLILSIFISCAAQNPEQEAGFKFSIEDVFSLSSGQLVVSGQVKSGEITKDEKLKIILEGHEKLLTIEKMEIFGALKPRDVVYKNDYVAFTISGLSKSDLKRGDAFTK